MPGTVETDDKTAASAAADCSKAAGLRVGRATKSGRVFFSMPDTHYDQITLPISGEKCHVAMVDDDDVEWLIIALAKEIGAERCRAVAGTLADLFCLVCDGSGVDVDSLEGGCVNCGGEGYCE